MVPCLQGVLHILLRGTSRAAVAAVNFDVAGVLTAANELAQGLINRFMPSFMGGGGTYAKQLFRKDGFFAYADERQSEVSLRTGCCRVWYVLTSALNIVLC